MGTVDNIFVLNGLISHLLNNNKCLYAAFIDFSKAFDYVVRDNLWCKLIRYGVRGKILNVIMAMYTSVKSRVLYHNNLSEDFECIIGVRQGECLSPFLFSIYVNDLEETLRANGHRGINVGLLKVFLLIYADDIILISETSDDLKKGLDILEQYCERWKLTVNVDKTKVMIFKRGGRLARNTSFTYNGRELEIVKKFTYLGFVFTTGGSFAENFNTLSGQGFKAMYKLNNTLQRFPNITIQHTFDLFDKLIVPVLSYGCEIWGLNNALSIEKVHLQYCKHLLGVRKQTMNKFVYSETGRLPIKYDIILRVIKYWFKVLKKSDTKFTKLIYNVLINDLNLNPGKRTWVTQVKETLESYGFAHVWLAQGVGNETIFLKLLKQRIRDNYLQVWNAQNNLSSRSELYHTFSSFGFKSYLKHVSISKFRFSLTRFRVSAHSLAIESGRWHKPNKLR